MNKAVLYYSSIYSNSSMVFYILYYQKVVSVLFSWDALRFILKRKLLNIRFFLQWPDSSLAQLFKTPPWKCEVFCPDISLLHVLRSGGDCWGLRSHTWTPENSQYFKKTVSSHARALSNKHNVLKLLGCDISCLVGEDVTQSSILVITAKLVV